jgi:hypothetical protein
MLGLAGMTVAEVERRLILETLEHTSNNRTRAARQLGISIRTLRNKLAEYRAAGWLPAGDPEASRRGGSPLSTRTTPGAAATA